MISCANHDYVEIACMYRFEVKITLTNGATIQGTAIETTYNEDREECVVIETMQTNQMIVLDQVATLEAITTNSHFSKIRFD